MRYLLEQLRFLFPDKQYVILDRAISLEKGVGELLILVNLK